MYVQGGALGGFITKNTHLLGFIHMGGRLGAADGVSGSIRAAFGGTPHTYKTNPVAIWGWKSAHLPPWVGGWALQDLWEHILESQSGPL